MLLIVHGIVAALAVAAIALRPASNRSGAAVVALAGVDAILGAPLLPALGRVLPLLVFLAAAFTLASMAERSGIAERVADRLAQLARGRSDLLFGLVCAVCAATTAVVSLDGAVVLMIPLVLTLSRRHGAPLAPLLLGTVAVANACSIAVPQGNPTNLVLIRELGLSPAAFIDRMFLPGLAAASACAIAAALLERRALGRPYSVPASDPRTPLGRIERHAVFALGAAGVAAFLAPLLGIPGWWPFAGVTALALLLHPSPTPRVSVPVRLGAQLTGLLVVIGALGLSPPGPLGAGALSLLAMAAIVGAASALANNLPVSVSAAGLLAAGPSAYAAAIGLGVGSLATRQGSVATLVAAERADPIGVRRLTPLAMTGVVAATAVLALHG